MTHQGLQSKPAWAKPAQKGLSSMTTRVQYVDNYVLSSQDAPWRRIEPHQGPPAWMLVSQNDEVVAVRVRAWAWTEAHENHLMFGPVALVDGAWEASFYDDRAGVNINIYDDEDAAVFAAAAFNRKQAAR